MKRAVYLIAVIFILAVHGPAAAQKRSLPEQIAPAAPPNTGTFEAEPEAPPPPPPPPDYKLKRPEISRGFFGWALNTDLGVGYTTGRGSAFNAVGKLTFGDPYALGSKIGLAEDAVEYKLGLGLVLGNDASNLSMFSIPFLAEAVVYLKEGSLFGLDPYLGGGLNLNLLGTDSTLGGAGWQLFGGILLKPGSDAGKTGIGIGYHSARVGNIRTLEGWTLFIACPVMI